MVELEQTRCRRVDAVPAIERRDDVIVSEPVEGVGVHPKKLVFSEPPERMNLAYVDRHTEPE